MPHIGPMRWAQKGRRLHLYRTLSSAGIYDNAYCGPKISMSSSVQPSSLNRVSDSRNKGRHTIRLIVTTINAITTVDSKSNWNWP
jgi:hypothetical protein